MTTRKGDKQDDFVGVEAFEEADDTDVVTTGEIDVADLQYEILQDTPDNCYIVQPYAGVRGEVLGKLEYVGLEELRTMRVELAFSRLNELVLHMYSGLNSQQRWVLEKAVIYVAEFLVDGGFDDNYFLVVNSEVKKKIGKELAWALDDLMEDLCGVDGKISQLRERADFLGEYASFSEKDSLELAAMTLTQFILHFPVKRRAEKYTSGSPLNYGIHPARTAFCELSEEIGLLDSGLMKVMCWHDVEEDVFSKGFLALMKAKNDEELLKAWDEPRVKLTMDEFAVVAMALRKLANRFLPSESRDVFWPLVQGLTKRKDDTRNTAYLRVLATMQNFETKTGGLFEVENLSGQSKMLRADGFNFSSLLLALKAADRANNAKSLDDPIIEAETVVYFLLIAEYLGMNRLVDSFRDSLVCKVPLENRHKLEKKERLSRKNNHLRQDFVTEVCEKVQAEFGDKFVYGRDYYLDFVPNSLRSQSLEFLLQDEVGVEEFVRGYRSRLVFVVQDQRVSVEDANILKDGLRRILGEVFNQEISLADISGYKVDTSLLAQKFRKNGQVGWSEKYGVGVTMVMGLEDYMQGFYGVLPQAYFKGALAPSFRVRNLLQILRPEVGRLCLSFNQVRLQKKEENGGVLKTFDRTLAAYLSLVFARNLDEKGRFADVNFDEIAAKLMDEEGFKGFIDECKLRILND